MDRTDRPWQFFSTFQNVFKARIVFLLLEQYQFWLIQGPLADRQTIMPTLVGEHP